MTRSAPILQFACLPLLVATLQVAATAQDHALLASAATQSQLPAHIVRNHGQWASPELFRVRLGGMQMFLEARGWSFWLEDVSSSRQAGAARRRGPLAVQPAGGRAVALRMEFVGAGTPDVIAEHPRAGVTNWLIGDDPRQYRTGLPGHGSVLYRSMYPGIDVRFRESAGKPEYDVLLAPGADLAQVQVRVAGATSLTLAGDTLVLDTPLGAVRQPQPLTWMEAGDGTRTPVLCRYVLHGPDRYGFAVEARDPTQPLVVDPTLLYSTYYGGSALDEPNQIVTTANGHLLVCGPTQSLNFPTSPGTIQPIAGGSTYDGYLLRLDPSQPPASQVVFATYFGGSGDESVLSIASLPGDLIAFCGRTTSTNLPVTAGAFQGTHAGGPDGYLAVTDGGGTTLLGLTYFGGPAFDEVDSVLANPAGGLLVAGNTHSTTLPTTANAFATTHRGGTNDCFVAAFDLQLTTQLYGSYFGGSGDEWMYCWDVDAAGVMTLFGDTSSTNLPVTANAFDPTHNGGGMSWDTGEAFVARFDPSLPPAQQLVYGTFLGGSGDDWAWMARSTPTGEIVVSGTTNSSNFPTTPNAYQRNFRGGIGGNGTVGDAFLVRLDSRLSGSAGLVAGTLLGGTGEDQGLDVAIDATGEVALAGWSALGSNLPTTPDALRRAYAGNDGYVARFSGDLRQLLYASLFGGSAADGVWLLAGHARGNLTAAGTTYSSNLPVQSAAQLVPGGGGDVFVSRFQLVPTDTTRRGRPTLGSNGWPTIHALGDAVSGNAQFGIACTRAPVGKPGLLMLAGLPAPGVRLLGIDVYVDPSSIAVSAAVLSNAAGESVFSLPIPAIVVPTLHAQFAWVENAGQLTLSASDALQIR